MTQTSFAAFGLSDALLTALARQSITTPTPIQSQAIPAAMGGRDVLGVAQTGTGKTAAFALPLCDALIRMGGRPKPGTTKALILAPTRELAGQIADNLKAYTADTKLTHRVVFGGVAMGPQIAALKRGVDIVVATPGRLVDLLNRGALSLAATRHLVLDEADRMLDMGFVRDVMRIVDMLPDDRRSALFSATMPPAIADLSARILSQPQRVEVAPERVAVEAIEQTAYFIPQNAKKGWLIDRLNTGDMARTVVFARTKHGANRLATDLEKAGIEAVAIHGNKSQAARQKALASFQGGRVNVLVATDIIARGIHVDDITHVVNFDLPEEPESYVHRIGRTARAGKDGIAFSLVDPTETGKHRAIERLTGQRLPLNATGDAELDARAAEMPTGAPKKRGGGGRPGAKRGGGGGRSNGAGNRNKGAARPTGKPGAAGKPASAGRRQRSRRPAHAG